MAGLFGEDYDDPKTQGILGFALQMLANSGGSPRRRTAGEIIGASGLGGMEQYNRQRALNENMRMNKIREELLNAQMQDYLARAERNRKLADQGISPDDPSNIREWKQYSQLSPEDQVKYLEMRRASPSFMGMPLQRSVDGGYNLPQNIVDYYAGARGLRENEAIGKGIGEARTTASTVLGPDNRPSYQLNIDRLRALNGGRLPGDSSPAVASGQFLPNEAPPELKKRIDEFNAGAQRTSGGPAVPRPYVESDPAVVKAKTKAAEEAKKEASLDAQATDYSRLQPIIQKIEDDGLLDKATGSLVGAGRDVALGSVGLTTKGAAANSALEPLVGGILRTVPRFEGPQSDADREEYKRQAGNLASATRTTGEKKAALASIKWLVSKYKYKHGEIREIDPAKGGGKAMWDTTVGKFVRID